MAEMLLPHGAAQQQKMFAELAALRRQVAFQLHVMLVGKQAETLPVEAWAPDDPDNDRHKRLAQEAVRHADAILRALGVPIVAQELKAVGQRSPEQRE